MGTSVGDKLELSIVRDIANGCYNPGRQTTQDLTGANHTTVDTCEDNATNVWSMNTTAGTDKSALPIAGKESRNRAEVYYPDGLNFESVRGRKDVIALSFEVKDDYASLKLATAENWTTNTQDDYLVFWLWADRAFLATEFDLELRDSSNALITNASFTVAAYTQAKVWQLYVIDTSTPTLSDVQYIRIQHDIATQTELRICDFVRTDADCIDNSYYVDLLVSTNLGHQARYLQIFLDEIEADNTAHVHINSLTNDPRPLYPSLIYECMNEPINAFFIHSMTSDTSVTLDTHVTGRWSP